MTPRLPPHTWAQRFSQDVSARATLVEIPTGDVFLQSSAKIFPAPVVRAGCASNRTAVTQASQTKLAEPFDNNKSLAHRQPLVHASNDGGFELQDFKARKPDVPARNPLAPRDHRHG